jgi:SnoaL-like protein
MTPIELSEQQVRRLIEAMPIGRLAPVDDEQKARRRRALEAVAVDDLLTTMISNDGMLTGEWHGLAGFFEAWDDWLAPFETYDIELQSVEPAAGGDGLLVFTHQRVVPRGTDVPIESDAAAFLEFRSEKLARIEFHLDPELARSAAREATRS